MTGGRSNRRDGTRKQQCDDFAAIAGGAPSSQRGGVTIVFTDEQIAYLDERMRLANQTRPMGRVGGTSLHSPCPDRSRVL